MGKVTKIFRKTASVMLASVMTGSACYAPVMAAPATGTSQSFSLGRVGTILDSVKGLISGDGAIEKDSHKKADTFASKRLIVKADKLKNIDKKKVIASYDGYYLLKYKSKKAARKAYEKYSEKSNGKTAIAADQPVHMATGSADAGGLTNVTKKDNPLAELKDNVSDITKAEVKKAEKKKVIALLDTGASRSSNVIESVSMLGGSGDDDNGHGEAMVKAITKENKKAQIISIKVLDKNGEGSVSSIVSGIAYAEKRGASIVNLSLSGLATEGNAVVTTAVNDAIRKGLIVVGAAGNNARDAANYIPGGINDVIVVGACYDNKKILDSSNYGNSVDAYAIADSTSEAAALMSGFLSKGGSIGKLDGNFFYPDQVKNEHKVLPPDPDTGISTARAYGEAQAIYDKVHDGGYDGYHETLSTKGEFRGVTYKKIKKAVEKNYDKYKGTEYGSSSLIPNAFQCGGWVGWCLYSAMRGDYSESRAHIRYAQSKCFATPFLRNAISQHLRIYSYENVKSMLKAKKLKKGDLIVMINNVGKYPRDDKGYKQEGDDHIAFYWGNDESGEDKMIEAGFIEWNQKTGPNLNTDDGRYNSRGYYIDNDGTKIGPYTAKPSVLDTFIHAKQRSYYFVIPWEIGHQNHVYAEAKKVWRDGEDQSDRPSSIKVTLQRKVSGGSWKNVAGYTGKTLNAANGWHYKTTKLDYDDDDGHAYKYQWKEDSVPSGYSATSSTNEKKKSSDGTTTYTYKTTMINTHGNTTNVKKKWVGYPGDDHDQPAVYDENGNLKKIEVMFRMNSFNEKLRGWKLKADGSGYDPNGTGAAYAGDGHLDWEYPVLNSGNDWSFSHSIPQNYSITWDEYAWRYIGEDNSQWKTFENITTPDWDLGPNSQIRTYTFRYQPLPNSSVTFTHDGNDWVGTNKYHELTGAAVSKSFNQKPSNNPDSSTAVGISAAVDSVDYQLYRNDVAYTDANHPNGWVVTLNDANQWTYSTGANSLPKYDTKDSEVPDDDIDGDADSHLYHYEWREVPGSMRWRGHNVSAILSDNTEWTDEPGGDNTDLYVTYGANYITSVGLHTTAVDSKTGTKAGVANSTGITDNVQLTNIAPRLTYTLTAQLYNKDGTPLQVNGQAISNSVTFKPEDDPNFNPGDGGPTKLTKAVNLNFNAKDLAGKDVVVYEWLAVDEAGVTVGSETNAADEDQTVHYPKIRTHMISNNPSKNFGHTMDGVVGDSDGKHFGTLQQSPNGTVSMTDTVSYSNLVNGTYTVEGVLHRRGRTTNAGQDLGAVVVDGHQVTASATFTVSNANPVSSGTVNVTYTFRFPENLYGGDYVSFETLKYNGIDLTAHADISDGQQTVRMPTSFRILKREAKQPDKPIADVTYQLFTKDEAGNLNPYKRDDGSNYILTTGADGTVEFRDLDIGKYWIKEIKVPKGVSLQATPFEMNAGESRVIETRNENIDVPMLTTGGKGTTMYYVAAAAVTAACAVAYVFKKRKQN